MNPILMYDGIHSDVPAIPASAQKVAGYISGANRDFWWTAEDWGRFPHAALIRIDTDGSRPYASDVLDVESGDATPAAAAQWVHARQYGKGWWSAVYCSESILGEVRAAMAAAGCTKVSYWIAHWGLTEAEATAKLTGDVVAVQYINTPSYDVSVTLPGWFAPPAPPPPPPVPVLTGILLQGGPHTYTGREVSSHDGGKTWA